MDRSELYEKYQQRFFYLMTALRVDRKHNFTLFTTGERLSITIEKVAVMHLLDDLMNADFDHPPVPNHSVDSLLEIKIENVLAKKSHS